MCVLTDVHVYLFSVPVFLYNLVLFSLCTEKCWRSERPNEQSKKRGKTVSNTGELLFDKLTVNLLKICHMHICH